MRNKPLHGGDMSRWFASIGFAFGLSLAALAAWPQDAGESQGSMQGMPIGDGGAMGGMMADGGTMGGTMADGGTMAGMMADGGMRADGGRAGGRAASESA